MLPTLDTSHFEMSPLNDVTQRNIAGMFLTLDTSHFERSRLNDFAARNILLMSFTLDTSHFERSALMSHKRTYGSCRRRLIRPSHSPIGRCGLLEQSPFGDSLRHAPTALLSCTLDCGTNAGLRVGAENRTVFSALGKLNESVAARQG